VFKLYWPLASADSFSAMPEPGAASAA
jgi:hypothetical protein